MIESSKVDPLLSVILKGNTSVMAPIFVKLINLANVCLIFLSCLKHPVVTLCFIRYSLPFSDYANRSPISNLPQASAYASEIRFRAPTAHISYSKRRGLIYLCSSRSSSRHTPTVCLTRHMRGSHHIYVAVYLS